VLLDADPPYGSDDEKREKSNKISDKVLRSLYDLKDGEDAMAEMSILEKLDQWCKVHLSRKKRDKNGVLRHESKNRKRRSKPWL
jgi:hypothetical protein